MKLAWLNKFDDALISSDSETSSLPVTNLQHVHIAKKWYTASGVKSAYVLADMGSQVAIGLVSFLGSNLTSSATIRIRASNADPTAVAGDILDTTVVSANVSDNYGAIYYLLSAETTAQYWRIDLADATVADTLQVGRCFMGPVWTPASGTGLIYGNTTTYNDGSRFKESKGGQINIDVGPRRRTVEFTIDYLSESDMYGNAFELARANGLNSDVLYIRNEDSNYVSEQSVFGLIKRAEPVVNQKGNIFRQRYLIEERL